MAKKKSNDLLGQAVARAVAKGEAAKAPKVEVVMPKASVNPAPHTRVLGNANYKATGLEKNAMRASINRLEPEAQAIVRSFCLPGEQGIEPVRVCDEGNSVATAVAHTYNRRKTYSAGASTLIGQYQGFAVVRARDVMHTLMMPQVASSAGSVIWFSNQTGGAPSATFNVTTGDVLWAPLLYRASNDVNQPVFYSNTLKGDQGTERILWLDTGAAASGMVVTFTSAPSAGVVVSGYATLLRFDGKQFVKVQTLGTSFVGVATSGLVTFNSYPAGYYALQVRFEAVTSVTNPTPVMGLAGTVGIVTNSLTNEQLMSWPMFELASLAPDIDSHRITASSFLWTNTSTELNRGGVIAGAQVAPGQSWQHIMLSQTGVYANPYAAVSALPGAVSLDAANGMYGSLRPTTMDQLQEWVETFSTNDSGVIVDSYPGLIDPDAADQIYGWDNTAAAAAFSGVITCDVCIEYATDRQSREKRLAAYTPQQYAMALEVLAKIPIFTENPLHFGKMMASIGQGFHEMMATVRKANSDGRDTLNEVAPNLLRLIDGITGRPEPKYVFQSGSH